MRPRARSARCAASNSIEKCRQQYRADPDAPNRNAPLSYGVSSGPKIIAWVGWRHDRTRTERTHTNRRHDRMHWRSPHHPSPPPPHTHTPPLPPVPTHTHTYTQTKTHAFPAQPGKHSGRHKPHTHARAQGTFRRKGRALSWRTTTEEPKVTGNEVRICRSSLAIRDSGPPASEASFVPLGT
jgi:hypothetical protein